MHPVGPHSSTVYWMRRALLIMVAVGLVIGLIWWLAGRGSADTAEPTDPQTSAATSTDAPVLTGVLAAPTITDDIYDDVPDVDDLDDPDDAGDTSGPVTITGSTTPATADDASAPVESDQPTSTGEADESKAADSSAKVGKKACKKAGKKAGNGAESSTDATAGDESASEEPAADKPAKDKPAKDKPARTTQAPPPPSYDEAGRLICPDTSVSVTAITWADTYAVGSQPRLGMAVTNTGTQSCVRDLSGAIQTYTVYTATGDRVWSTADCFPGEGHEVRQLSPGSTANFIVVWAGTTSEPGCAAPRTPVKAGKYVLVAKLGALKSAKHPFRMR